MSTSLRLVSPFLLVTLLAAAGAATASPPARTADANAARNYFTDVRLIDQDGKELRLYSDLLQDRVVIIASMFTTCEGVCPVTMANLQKIQKWLGPRLGKDVTMLALTVDPATDTVPRLKSYAEKFHAREGWYFLTGERDNLEFALRRLGLYSEQKEGHAPIFLVGNEATGLWKKALGMASSQELIAIVETVLHDDGTDSGIEPGAAGAAGPARSRR